MVAGAAALLSQLPGYRACARRAGEAYAAPLRPPARRVRVEYRGRVAAAHARQACAVSMAARAVPPCQRHTGGAPAWTESYRGYLRQTCRRPLPGDRVSVRA